MANKKSLISGRGFTIVELIVTIVIIGIIASISVVSYRNVTKQAATTALKSDLSNADDQLVSYLSIYHSFPTSLDANNCPLTPSADKALCLKVSSGNKLSGYFSDGKHYSLIGSDSNSVFYTITDTNFPYPSDADPDWVVVSSQTWSRKNLDVGDMISVSSAQTDNSVVEKHCYDNLPENCAIYGGLYQWDEAMQYVTTNGAQGLCPTGSHIPTDVDFMALERMLNMSEDQIVLTGWRGTDQGVKLRYGGGTGLDFAIGGHVDSGSFWELDDYGGWWSSTSTDSSHAYYRELAGSARTNIKRDTVNKVSNSYSIRCIKNS